MISAPVAENPAVPTRDDALPVIVDPFSRFADEIAGEMSSEIALNLAAGTRIALSFHRKPLRRCPDLWAAFAGCRDELSPDALKAIERVAQTYQQFFRR